MVPNIKWCYNFCFSHQRWCRELTRKRQAYDICQFLIFPSLSLLMFPGPLPASLPWASEDFLWPFCKWPHVSIFLLLRMSLFSLHFSKVVSRRIENLWLTALFFQDLKNIMPLPSGLCGFRQETRCPLNWCSFMGTLWFPSGCFQDFFLVCSFQKFNFDASSMNFGGLSLSKVT